MKSIKVMLIRLLILLGISIIAAGCTEQQEAYLEVFAPEEDAVVGDEFVISGVLHHADHPYFIYFAEDGHTYLGEGIIYTDEQGHFESRIELRQPPIHQQVMLYFYLDDDGDGKYKMDDPRTKIGQLLLRYDKQDSDRKEKHQLLDQDLMMFVREQIFEAATVLREDWRMSWDEFAKAELPMLVLDDVHLAAWLSDAVGGSVFTVFGREEDRLELVFTDLLGRDIYHVGLHEGFHKGPLVTVDVYVPAGTGVMQRHTVMYLLSRAQTKRVWELETANTSVRETEEGIIERRRTLSYTLPPSFMQPDSEPVSYVHGKEEERIISDAGTKIIEEKFLQLTYHWDETEGRFVNIEEQSRILDIPIK